MIREAANGKGKSRKQASGSSTGKTLANSLTDSAQQDARSLLQLRAKATAAEVSHLMETGAYHEMVWNELVAIFDGSQAVLEAQIMDIDEAFLLPPSSSPSEVEGALDSCFDC